jgi:hypothetical protein
MTIKLTPIQKGTLGQRQTSTDEVIYGQGDDGQVLDHCSKYIHGVGRVANPCTRGGREQARPGTDLEGQDDYRVRYAAEQDARFEGESETRLPSIEIDLTSHKWSFHEYDLPVEVPARVGVKR